MTKKELIQELEGIPDDTVIQVWTQWDDTAYNDFEVDVTIVELAHIIVLGNRPPKTNEN
jgi:hypothetical protein